MWSLKKMKEVVSSVMSGLFKCGYSDWKNFIPQGVVVPVASLVSPLPFMVLLATSLPKSEDGHSLYNDSSALFACQVGLLFLVWKCFELSDSLTSSRPGYFSCKHPANNDIFSHSKEAPLSSWPWNEDLPSLVCTFQTFFKHTWTIIRATKRALSRNLQSIGCTILYISQDIDISLECA